VPEQQIVGAGFSDPRHEAVRERQTVNQRTLQFGVHRPGAVDRQGNRDGNEPARSPAYLTDDFRRCDRSRKVSVETALVKLSRVLGHTDDHADVLRMMRHPVNRKITDREPHNG
jgi:hypothetical protein